MKLADVLKKIANGEKLTDEEMEFLKSYKEDESRIPKSRLDEEIQKRKASDEQVNGLQAKLDELNQKLEDLQNQSLTDAEKAKKATEKQIAELTKQVQSLTTERDAAKSELAASARRARVSEIAQKYGFTNADYLSFLMQGAELKLDDDNAVTTYMGTLTKEQPELFRSTAKPGSGAQPQGGNDVDGAKARIETLFQKPTLTQREAAEVIELNAKINGTEANKNGE